MKFYRILLLIPFHNLMVVLLSQQYKESNNFPISGVYSSFCYIKRLHWSDSLACCVIKH